MGKHGSKPRQALAARQKDVPSSGMYVLGNGKRGFYRKPGSQNRKKGFGSRGRRG